MTTELISAEMVLQKHPYSFASVDEMPQQLKDEILSGYGDDIYTLIQQGKEWAFELTKRYQPRTAEVLLSGGDFMGIMSEYGVGNAFLEVQGQVVKVGRRFLGQNLHQMPLDHIPEAYGDYDTFEQHLNALSAYDKGRCERRFSLPMELRRAYYERYDGMVMPDSRVFGIYPRILPFDSASAWRPIDYLLSDYRLMKKYLPLIREMIPYAQTEDRNMPYLNFMMFLSSCGSFEPKTRRDGDFFFIKTHIKDRIVYYIRDMDVPNMMILADPAEAIDRYCEHALLHKEGRFDFRPWAIPFEDVVVPESYKHQRENKTKK